MLCKCMIVLCNEEKRFNVTHVYDSVVQCKEVIQCYVGV